MDKEHCLLYEAGEMYPREAAQFERHLPGCPDCRAWLSVIRRAHGWADVLSLEPAEDSVPARETRPEGSSTVDRTRSFLAPLTLALSFACLAVLVLHNRRSPESSRGAAAGLRRELPAWDSSPLAEDILRTRERLASLERDVEQAKSWSKGEQP